MGTFGEYTGRGIIPEEKKIIVCKTDAKAASCWWNDENRRN